jgi:serine protease Do
VTNVPSQLPSGLRAQLIRSLTACVVLACVVFEAHAKDDISAAIAKVKPSVVVVGYFQETSSPRFRLRGTGFVVFEANLVATNAHVLDPEASPGAHLSVYVRAAANTLQLRRAVLVEVDKAHDLALLRFEGEGLPALSLRDSDSVKEGESVAFVGFPIGGVLGFVPVTHRGMISSITPVAMPSPSARQLDPRAVTRLKEGSFDIFQLDATAYPGNSGGPVFDPESGAVIGVINMVVLKGTRESALSAPSGISYAIPAKYLVELMRRSKGK